MKEGRKEWNEKYEKGINCIPYEFQDEKNSVKIKFIERRESMTKEVNWRRNRNGRRRGDG